MTANCGAAVHVPATDSSAAGAQAGVDLPEALFAEGPEGDEELMRFALCYNILQVRWCSQFCYNRATAM